MHSAADIMRQIPAHEQWVQSCGQTVRQGQQLRLMHQTLEHLTLTGRNLQNAELIECELIGCRFSDTDLFGCAFAGSRLCGCSFTKCILGKSVLSGAVSENTEFTDCTLIKADMRGIRLRHTAFTRCDLTRTWLGAAALAEEITLNGCDLTDCDLPDVIRHTKQRRLLGRTVTVTVDRPLGSFHPEYPDMYYPVNYGYVRGILAPDGEEQDAYILGISEPVREMTGVITAVVDRKDDVEDKWVVCPAGCTFTKEEIAEQIRFQEQYFRSEIIL